MHATKLPEARLEPKGAERGNLSCSIDPDLKAALADYAKKKKVTVSSVVAVAVTEYLQGEASK